MKCHTIQDILVCYILSETADYKMSESELKQSRKDVETVVVKVIQTWNV